MLRLAFIAFGVLMAVLLLKPSTIPSSAPGGCAISFSTSATFLAPTSGLSGKRIYLYHGLNSPTFFDSGPGAYLVAKLRASGHQVVLPVLPNAQTCFYSNGGGQYREQFLTALNAIKSSMDIAHGPANDIVGGISYGGLHAMMAAAMTGHFTSWFAHLPVVRVDALTELSGVGDAKMFNPQFETAPLKLGNGRLSWGTADTRVNYTLTVDLASKLGEAVVGVPYPGLDHTTTEAGMDDLAGWIGTL